MRCLSRYLFPALLAALVVLTPTDASAQRRRGSRLASGGAQSGLSPELMQTVIADFSGTLRNFDKKHILLDTADGQTLVFERIRATVLLPAKGHAALENGWTVQVESRKNSVGDLEAIRVCENVCPKAPTATAAKQ